MIEGNRPVLDVQWPDTNNAGRRFFYRNAVRLAP